MKEVCIKEVGWFIIGLCIELLYFDGVYAEVLILIGVVIVGVRVNNISMYLFLRYGCAILQGCLDGLVYSSLEVGKLVYMSERETCQIFYMGQCMKGGIIPYHVRLQTLENLGKTYMSDIYQYMIYILFISQIDYKFPDRLQRREIKRQTGTDKQRMRISTRR